jgi:hypothetical protein
MNFLSADFVDGVKWMALRQLAFGAHPGAVPKPLRQRLEYLDLIASCEGRLIVTSQGFEKLALAMD